MFKTTINYFKNRSVWFWAVILSTIIIDALNSAFYEKTQSFFFGMLNGKDLKSIFLLIGFFVLFILLIIFSSFLSSFDKPLNKKQIRRKKATENLFIFINAGFGIILTMPAINILQIGNTESSFSDTQQMTYTFILIGLFFVLLPISIVKFKTKFYFGKRNYFIAYVILLVIVSFYIDFSSALWKNFLFDPTKIADPNRRSKLIEFIATFPLFLIFFSAPRMILLKRSYTLLTLFSAFAMTAYFVWESLNIIEL